MKRREFLKGAVMAGTAVSVAPLFDGLTFAQQGTKSKVVIATDQQCFVNNAAQASRVQDMVDHTIMTLTGKSGKAAAYEALFPKPVTAATKILIKFNESSGQNSLSLKAVQAALTSGLKSMLNGTYPAGNISTLGTGGTATGPKFTVGTDTYQIKSAIVDCDYFINFAVCWTVGSNTAGVTLTLKNMMGAIAGNLSGGIHANFQNASTPSLSIINSQQMFKDKQVLALIDAISICLNGNCGPFTAPNAVANSIIASKDMVAADYQGFLLLKGKGLTSDRVNVATTVFNNAAKPVYGLGTNDPNNMEIVNIAPPWTTSVTFEGRTAEETGLGLIINHENGGSRVTFTLKDVSSKPVGLTIFRADGLKIWSSKRLEWNGETTGGTVVGHGLYFYAIKTSQGILRGKVIFGS
jgi:uncharacterized protein (DUF362 family)